VQEKLKKGKPKVVIQKKGPPRGTQKVADKLLCQLEESKKAAKLPLVLGGIQPH
jgi:hypothetical protein